MTAAITRSDTPLIVRDSCGFTQTLYGVMRLFDARYPHPSHAAACIALVDVGSKRGWTGRQDDIRPTCNNAFAQCEFAMLLANFDHERCIVASVRHINVNVISPCFCNVQFRRAALRRIVRPALHSPILTCQIGRLGVGASVSPITMRGSA